MRYRFAVVVAALGLLVAACGTITTSYNMDTEARVSGFSMQISVSQGHDASNSTPRQRQIVEAIAHPESMTDEQFARLMEGPPSEDMTFLDEVLARHSHLEGEFTRWVDNEEGFLRTEWAFPSGQSGTLAELLPSVENVVTRVDGNGGIYVELDGQSLLSDLLNEAPACLETTTTLHSTTTTLPCHLTKYEKSDIRDNFSIYFGLTLPYPIVSSNGVVDSTLMEVAWGPLEYDFDLQTLYVQTEAPTIDQWTFPDVPPSHWASEAIEWAVDSGIMEARPAKARYEQEVAFQPHGGVSERDISIYLHRFNRLLGGPEAPDGTLGSDYYEDVVAGDEADRAVGWAVHRGIVAPFNSSCFYMGCDPDGWLVTRVAIVTYVYRASILVGGPNNPDQVRGHDRFSDVPDGYWADQEIGWAAANDIARGVGSGLFYPPVPTNRQEVAAFLYRLHEKVVYLRTLTGE